MKELDSIILEHVHWLQKRGYDEKGLNNGEAEGVFRLHLRDALQQVIDSDAILFDKETFKVLSFGLFDNNKDKVLFTFLYEFDALDRKLSLKEVEATMKQIPISLQIEIMDDLWHSKDLYQRAKELSVPILNAAESQRQENISKLINYTNKYLQDLEYEKYSIKPAGWIVKRLTTILNKAENKANSIYYFNLRTNLQNGPTLIKASIHFEYISNSQQLSLKWIHAGLGESKERFLPISTKLIPKASEVLAAIQLKVDIKKAHKISQGPKESQMKIRRIGR